MSERKPSKIDNVKWAIHRAVAEAKPERLAKAKWLLYGAVGLSTLLLFGSDGGSAKYPRGSGD